MPSSTTVAERRNSSCSSPKAPSRRPSMDFTLDVDEDDDDDLYNNQKMPEKDSNHTLETADETDSEGDEADYVQPENARAVHFKMTVKKRFIESHILYSEEERQACWYTSEEKETSTTKRDKIVIRMEAGKPEKRSRPYRGLDCWTQKGSKLLNEQISKTIDAVMDEQDAQWDSGFDDCERIASLSQAVTYVSAEKALHTAYEDEQEAIKIRGVATFDDVDDESTVGMASLVAKKRRERGARRGKKNGRGGADGDTLKTKRRAKKKKGKENNRSDPPGEMATPKLTKEKIKTRKVKAIKRVETGDKSSGTGKLKLKQKRNVQ